MCAEQVQWFDTKNYLIVKNIISPFIPGIPVSAKMKGLDGFHIIG